MNWLTPTARWLAGALASTLLLQWLLLPSSPESLSRDRDGAASGPDDAAAVVDAPSLALGRVGVDQVSVIVDRPLFSQNRRPPPEVEIVETEPEPPPPPPPPPVEQLGLVLQAIIMGFGEPLVIMVDLSGTTLRMRPGDEFNGWTLDEVEPERVHFVNRGQRQTVQMRPLP